MIKIKGKEFIMETIGVSVPSIEDFLIGFTESDDLYEEITFVAAERDCFISCTSGATYDANAKNGIQMMLKEDTFLETIQEQPAEISINGMTGYCVTYYSGTIQYYAIYFDSINDNENVLVLKVAIDTTGDRSWVNKEERINKAYEKLKKVLERDNIKHFINGIKMYC